MFSYLRSFMTKTKSTLFTFNNEPFSKFSILLILILDIFLFITILTGIDSEKDMSPAVSVKYPYQCKSHFDPKYKRSVWNSATRGYTYDRFPFSEYASFYITAHSTYESGKKFQSYTDKRMAPLCTELYQKIAVFAQTKAFKNNKELTHNLRNEKRNVLSEINSIEKRYNTALFEKISSSQEERDKKIRDKYYSLLEKEKNIDRQIKEIKSVAAYKGYQAYVDFVNTNRERFNEAYDSYAFWQPFISFLYLLKFTFPLLLLSFLAHRFSTSPARKISVPNKLVTLISSHIIIITLLPLCIDVMRLIFHIIPKRFLEKIITFLYEYGFIFLGYYFLMLLGIVGIGLVVFFIQRSVSRREKRRREMKEKTLYIDAYNQSRCPHCKNRVDYSKNYCGFCKEELNRVCSACNKRTPKHIQYCIECGT
ncbi:zinc ribbon domain-containing protein [Sulfurovum sp. XGS-02]|uniref:zinc ribbon domain-containing protein n=1 Tax=Sulfurovum sp. XGS-02 TaxID=2925411 RepID=UPI00206A4E97|nr:zinc ribbon domain-containing protein [Sulfurovum sp. XGS-02]UPT77379.1 zinc ribbon domain-containing protein [Sulfurovum sp. XGS-02]